MKKTGFIAGISFLAGAIFFALAFGYIQNSDGTPVIKQEEAFAQSKTENSFNFVSLVKKVKPAVVKVESEAIRERRSMFRDDLFDRFFNNPKRKERVSGMGSGFLISSDGFIITNNHVVKDAIKVTISTIDGKKHIAKIIGTDSKTDLALLKIKGKNHPYVELGNSEKVEVGEWVLAIGNPFSQDLTVTSGIISAKGRRIRAAEYEDYLQTDAAINRGNSGGPLINLKGKVIGINSVIIAPAGGSVGIGFAIPSDMAKKVIGDIKTKGRVIRGWFGISIQEFNKEDAKQFDYPVSGLLITQVENNSPAEKSGLKRNDFIIKLNNKRIRSGHDLKLKIANANPGEIIPVTIFRGDKKLNIKVKIGEAPDTLKFRTRGDDGRTVDLGMILVDNSRSLAREYELRTSQGIVVQKAAGIATRNGIKAFDVILGVNRAEITSVEQFRKIMGEKKSGSYVFLYINRFGQEFYNKFKLPE
ncbi:MAG: Do family serine endopeptidase [Acidobacteriota bacterium]